MCHTACIHTARFARTSVASEARNECCAGAPHGLANGRSHVNGPALGPLGARGFRCGFAGPAAVCRRERASFPIRQRARRVLSSEVDFESGASRPRRMHLCLDCGIQRGHLRSSKCLHKGPMPVLPFFFFLKVRRTVAAQPACDSVAFVGDFQGRANRQLQQPSIPGPVALPKRTR